MSAQALIAGLERLRRRAGLVATVRLGAPAGVAVLGAIVAARAFGVGGADRLPVAVVPAIVALLGAAVGWRRRPSLLDAARHADAAQARQATLVTALEVRHGDDPFAARVLEQGVSSLAGLDAARVYPWRWTRTSAALTVIGLLTASLSLTAPDADERAGSSGGSGTGSGDVTGVAPARTSTAAAGRALAPTPDTAPRPAPANPASPSPAPPTPPAPERTSAPDARSTASTANASGALEARASRAMDPARTASGGGRTGGGSARATRTSGGERPGASVTAATSSAAGPAQARAAVLEHVPMNRRATVRRYLQALAGPEPR